MESKCEYHQPRGLIRQSHWTSSSSSLIMSTTTETITAPDVELSRLDRDEPHIDTLHDDATSAAEQSRVVDAGVPDGGYGWVAVAACSMLSFWFIGTTYCWGLFQAALVDKGTGSPSTLAWIGSVMSAGTAIFSIVSARLLSRLGSRRTALCGVCFTVGGELLSGFAADNVGGLFVTAGVLMGVGNGMSLIVVGSIAAQYFSEKRGLANGIIFAGGGLGGAVISFLIEALLRKTSVAWTFRILGFITLVTDLPAAWLLKDRVPPNKRVFIEWELFKDFNFLVLFLAGAVGTFPLLVPPFFLPLYGASIGLGSSANAALVAAFNLASAFGRIGSGFLSDKLGAVNTLAGSLVLNGLSILALWPVSTTIAPLVVFTIINGAAAGGFFSLMPTVAGAVFGSARVSVVLGMLITGWAGGYLMVSCVQPQCRSSSVSDADVFSAGGAHSWLPVSSIWRPKQRLRGIQACNVLCRIACPRFGRTRCHGANAYQQEADEEGIGEAGSARHVSTRTKRGRSGGNCGGPLPHGAHGRIQTQLHTLSFLPRHLSSSVDNVCLLHH